MQPMPGFGHRSNSHVLTDIAPSAHSGKLAVRRFAGTRDLVERLGRPIRVAHLTDQHVGRITPMSVQHAAVDAINAAKPDLVAITGDFVAHSLDYLDALSEVLRRIDAPAFGVLGNHDHWSGAAGVRRAVRVAGVELLDNAHTTIEIAGVALQVVGIDDAYTGNDDVERAVRGLRRDRPTIGLSHIAERAEDLWDHGVSVVLSGHTHSGQIALGALPRLIGHLGGHKYVHGLYGRRSDAERPHAVYVSAGIGAAVFGMRMGDRGQREVAFFDLGVEPGAFEEHHVEQEALGARPIPQWRQRLRHEKARRLRERNAERDAG
jgi:predicted MPP superfamily phosphohydrolase